MAGVKGNQGTGPVGKGDGAEGQREEGQILWDDETEDQDRKRRAPLHCSSGNTSPAEGAGAHADTCTTWTENPWGLLL